MSDGNVGPLPATWAETTLGAVHLDLARGVNPSERPTAAFSLFSVPSHEFGVPEEILGRQIGSNKQTVEPGTVLLCKINPRINRVWVVGDKIANEAIASTEWITFFPVPSVEPRFLAYYLRRNEIRDFLARNASGVGGSLMRVRSATLRDLRFVIAPLPEQIRIADALDELLSDLDAGVRALERVRAKLKQYRAAVLKAAVDGALTADWRARHPDAEPAAALLNRVLAERWRRWEAGQRRKFEDAGKVPPNGWEAKYVDPAPPDTASLSELPEGWCWATADQLAWSSGYGTSERCLETNVGLPVLRIPNVVGGGLDLTDLKFAATDYAESEAELVSVGDLLVVRTNGSRTLIGRGAVVQQCPSRPIYFASYLIRLRLVPIKPLLGWMSVLWSSPPTRRWIEARAATSAGQHNISLSTLETMAVPLPPEAEQSAIVEAVEAQLSVVDYLDADVAAKLRAAAALRQSILRSAFEGTLVPQDAGDEPASALLARIATERAERAKTAKRGRPKTPRAART